MDFIKEAIRQNEQWETGKMPLPRLDGPLVKRAIFSKLGASAKRKFVTILRGLRRTGKSVLARRFVQLELERGAKASSLAWFEFDRGMKATADDLASLISFFQSRGAKTIVLDEVAFVAGWQDVLKRFYDRTELKFIVTGSSALEMDRRSAESLAGRFDLLSVKPFSFSEYLELLGKGAPSTQLALIKNQEELQLRCEEYLVAGGLPEAAKIADSEERKAYITSSLLEPLFYKDIPSIFPDSKPDMLSKSLELLSATAGSTFQFQSIAQILGCSHPTAAHHAEVLQRALLLKISYNFTLSEMKQRRTAKKAIIGDNGVLSALRSDVPLGVLAENAAAASADSAYFWRDRQGHEVDILLPQQKLAIEVKYQEHITTSDEKNLQYFLERRGGWKGILLTKKDEEKGEIERIPMWKWLLLGERRARSSRPT